VKTNLDYAPYPCNKIPIARTRTGASNAKSFSAKENPPPGVNSIRPWNQKHTKSTHATRRRPRTNQRHQSSLSYSVHAPIAASVASSHPPADASHMGPATSKLQKTGPTHTAGRRTERNNLTMFRYDDQNVHKQEQRRTVNAKTEEVINREKSQKLWSNCFQATAEDDNQKSAYQIQNPRRMRSRSNHSWGGQYPPSPKSS
jgi:hypothetical protein